MTHRRKTILTERVPGILMGCLLLAALAGCGEILAGSMSRPATTPTSLPGGQYRLDPDHSSILFKVSHLGLSTFVGRFNETAAVLDFDPGNPADARLEATIVMRSVDTGVAVLDEQLRGASWFQVGRFPEARFTSTGIEILSDGKGRVAGLLEFHGQTRPLVLDVTFNGGADNPLTGAYTLGFAATGTLVRSEFGMNNLVPAVGDAVMLEIDVEFQRQ